jgi:flagellar basal body-associated protein FliL
MMAELNAALEDISYARTRLLKSDKTSQASFITSVAQDKSPKKKTKFIIIAVLACIIALSVLSAYLLSNKTSDKEVARTPAKTTPLAETKPEVNPEPQPPKEVVEKDTVTRGVLDSKKPVILSSDSSNSKGKDKKDNKKVHVQFALNPAAAVSNSKLTVELTHIQVIEDDIIAVLSIQNTADSALKIDLNKTYLINGKNESTKSYNPNSANLLAIPQSSNKQELKLYFKDFNFEGNTYTLKTVLSSISNKDINLFIDIK